MTWNPLHLRRSLVRLALLFAVVQLIGVAGVLFALPAMRSLSLGPVLIMTLVVVDFVVLSVIAGWIIRGSVSVPLTRLLQDVQRIAEGDLHHRLGETHRPELRELEDSINRLADRLIADRMVLAENVKSLEDTNRELHLARDQVVRSARLASAGTLAAGIAHEVGNPLGAIMAYADVAIARVQKTGADPEILDSIRSEAKRIDRIVRGLLDYARPQGAERVPAGGAEVLLGVRRLLEGQGKLDGVQAVWELDEVEPHTVLEPHRLEQVMVNLLLNALQAVEGVEGARVEVRLFGEEGEITNLPARREDDPPDLNYLHRRRLAQDEGGGDSVSTAESVTVIEVSDNGPGIADEDLEHLFDPFFTTKEPGEGTGLGLSICARLVEGMGGRIDADSGPQGGGRFTIRLPSIDGAAAESFVKTEDLETT